MVQNLRFYRFYPPQSRFKSCNLEYESWYQKTRFPWLPDGVNRMILRSLVLMHYLHFNE